MFISFLLASLGCGRSLKDRHAKSPDEAAINVALLPWESSWNNGDPADVLTEDAQIMYGGDKATAPKKNSADIIPQGMKANPTVIRGPPEIEATGQTAVATTSLSTRGRSMPVTFELAKTTCHRLTTRFTY